VTAGFVIAPLAAAHDRHVFSSGAVALDRYLQMQANQDMRRHIANCFVASPVQSNVMAGYYTLSAASIPVADLPEKQTRKLPRYPVLPAAVIGRLAVDKRYQGQNLGSRNAVRRRCACDPRRCRGVRAGGRCEGRNGGAVLSASWVRGVCGKERADVSDRGDGEEGGGRVSSSG
jgi:hypothetical protein